MSSSSQRTLPNILITGTPATGKTTLCQTLLSLANDPSSNPSTPPLKLQHLQINDIIKSNSAFHSGSDTKSSEADTEKGGNRDRSLVVDDDNLDALMDHISTLLHDGAQGGFMLDWHSSSGFATRWIDLVVIITCPDTAVLYDRLKARGYGEEKVQENIDAEIFGVVGEEVRESWEEDKGQVVELKSESAEEIEENADRILEWARAWMMNRTVDEVVGEVNGAG